MEPHVPSFLFVSVIPLKIKPMVVLWKKTEHVIFGFVTSTSKKNRHKGDHNNEKRLF